MKKLSAVELLKTAAIFGGMSATVADAGLLLISRATGLDIPGSWYINAPLAAWVVVGLPVTVKLAERLHEQARGRGETKIVAGLDDGDGRTRKIPLNYGGRQSTLLASVAPSIFGERLPAAHEIHRPACWHVTVDGGRVVVREAELLAFMEAAARRNKHQFSRRYWTQARRPPLFSGKYRAFMALLTNAGLVDGRHEGGRASGRLVTKPHYALTYLKHESPYRVT